MYNMNFFPIYLLLLLCIVFITILSIQRKPVIEHWGNSRRRPFSLPTIYIPRFVTPPGMTPPGMMTQSASPTPTIKKVDVFSKYEDTIPHITMSNPTFRNIDINSLKIGDASITRDTTNSNLIIGSSNIGVDINRNTIFNKPVLIDEDVDTLAVKEYAFVNGRTHLINEDFKLKDRFCFFDSNDTNCLLKDDVEYMYLASNYVNEAKVLMSACISKDGLQTSGSEVDAKNIALDDNQLCISKDHTMPMLSTWASKTPDEDTTTSSESVDEEAPSNVCTKDDIEITQTYTYNGSDFTTYNQVEDIIEASVCTDIWNSCGTQKDYNQVIRFKNKNTSDCDFEDVTTNLEDSTYTCLDTQHCKSDCKEPNKKYFNRVCYNLYGQNDLTIKGVYEKSVRFKDPSNQSSFINLDGENMLMLITKPKSFKIRVVDGSMKVVEDNDRNRRWNKSDTKVGHLRGNLAGSNIAFFYENGKYLIKVESEWLCIEGNNIVLKSQPNTDWIIDLA